MQTEGIETNGQEFDPGLLGQQKEAGHVKNIKPTPSCCWESFIALNRCSQPQLTLNPAWFGSDVG